MGVHVHVFARLVQNAVKASGMPNARQAFVPTPLMNSPPAVLREYVEGHDPIHGRPFMAEVFDQLTNGTGDGELGGQDWDRSSPRYVEADSEEEMRALFEERRYTDFLPIVLPTEERVERMLAGTSHAPDEMVGKMRPTIGMEFWHYDVERVAVNAVMAGAEPEHFPVLLALASSGDTGRQSSMSSMGNMVVVNGPIRHEIGMNMGIGAMGPYNKANSAIGRAFGLLSQNLQGGSVPGETYSGSQGSNLTYNCCCFAENEEASPWDPYHTQFGYEKDESAVTVSYIWGNVWSEYLRTYWEEKLVAMISGLEPGMGCTLVLDPIVAREFVEKGFDTKEKLIQWIHENAKIPRRRYWDHVMLNLIHEVVEAGIEPFAGYWAAGPEEPIPVFEPNRINIVVAGGETNGHFSIFMGSPMRAKFRSNPDQNATVSIDAWR
ncbi:MAG TPA: UGSC family (seleno)protein [Thermoleophilaceae bacterium]|nr:UGSC family (seleno)protein [Thermoleophilaceae bacterium]